MTSIEQLEEINNCIRDAEFERNISYLHHILTDDFLLRRAGGTLEDKASYLTALSDKNNCYSELVNISSTTTINKMQDKAISIVNVRAVGERGLQRIPFSGIYKNIRFFRKITEWALYGWYNEVID